MRGTLTPDLRKAVLTAHVGCSVGWLGAVASFLALAIAGLTSPDAQLVRAAYLSLPLLGWFVIMPLSLAALATGLVQAVGTPWGLLRHYWVLAKLLITALCTALLTLHLQPANQVADAAAAATFSSADLRLLRVQLATDAGAAMVALVAALTLAVFKPRGMTPRGRRRDAAAADGQSTKLAPRWVYAFGFFTLVALLTVRQLTHGSH